MTSSLEPTATPIVAPSGPPSNAVDPGGDVQRKPAGAGLPPASQVSDDDADDVSIDVSASLSGLSVDQLVALDAAGGNPAAIAAALGQSGVAPVPAVEVEEVVEQVPGTPGAPPAPVPAAGAPGRISLKGLPDNDAAMVKTAISAVKAGTYTTFAEAMAGLYPTPVPAAAAAGGEPVAPVVDDLPEFDPDVPMAEPQALVDLRAELERIDTDFAAAKASYDSIAQGDLLRERQDVIRKLDKEESKFEAAKEQVTRFEAAVDASSERALKQFPDLTVEGSELYNLLGDEIILARSKGDDILKYPDWPEKIAIRTSEKLKRTTGAVSNPPTQPDPTPQIPAPPPPGVRMPGSLVGPGNQAVQLNAVTAAAELETMDPDAQLRALELADRRLQGRR